MRITMCLIVMLVCGTMASAGKLAGVTMPDTATVGDKSLVLNGMGLREATWLKIDVYVAGLYLEKVSSDAPGIVGADSSNLLVLHFVRDVDRDDIVKAWSDGFKSNATVPIGQIKPLIDRLNAWMPGFADGDTLSFSYIPTKGVEVTVNGKLKGVVQGEDFARSLFSIWLGPNPPTGALKRGLLGDHRRSR
jgi:hypothetical protein